jgi:glyoxylase-like metal-dependent hydrolase (beta-lactamase superfamily II)
VTAGTGSATAPLVPEVAPGQASGIGVTGTAQLPDRVIEDGAADLVPERGLTARWTPGHTPGHLCFTDEAVGRLRQVADLPARWCHR